MHLIVFGSDFGQTVKCAGLFSVNIIFSQTSQFRYILHYETSFQESV